MLYPVYVHVGDSKHAHGVTFPDFPGCFAAADEWADLPAAIQEAVQAHFHGKPDALQPRSRRRRCSCSCSEWAVSSLKRDAFDEIRGQCREHFVRGMEVEDLARAVVQ